MDIQQQIAETKLELTRLCVQAIWERIKTVFDNHPALQYFHFARHGENKMDRHLAINGIRWEEIDFFVHAYDFEYNRRDPNQQIEEFVHSSLKSLLPDFKLLRSAAEEVYYALLDLTAQDTFSTMGNNLFRVIVTRSGLVSLKALTREEANQYPVNPRNNRID